MEYIRNIEIIKEILESEKILDTRSSQVMFDKITAITYPKDYIQSVSDINIDNVIYNESDFMELLHKLITDSLFVQECGKEIVELIKKCEDEDEFCQMSVVHINKVLEFVTTQVRKKKMIYPTIDENNKEDETNFEKGQVRVADYVFLKDTLQTILIKLMKDKML